MQHPPAGEGYPTPSLHYAGDVLEPVALPGVLVPVATVLGED